MIVPLGLGFIFSILIQAYVGYPDSIFLDLSTNRPTTWLKVRPTRDDLYICQIYTSSVP